MTASERNLWRMAELAVKNNNVDEVFKDIMEKCDLKTLHFVCLSCIGWIQLGGSSIAPGWIHSCI